MPMFRLTFKDGLKTIGVINGRKMPNISSADAMKAIELEQLTERVTGLRLHVELVVGRDR